ncbi:MULTISPECIES: preprotein translocase [Bacillus]|uniref:preprotein translocase n=1 Tax=Bacillus TaxID=1386 RepID=UPI000B741055|nr:MULTISPECIES: preprotein translocase [Bacillus]OUB02914.1 preprotein translocase [Bacillus thuringiensis serovar shandongiensis]AXK17112.1 preprotein translocase [Bacillus sp. COPE52]MBJ8101775.1 preprotein translocase [Bacillus cereus group sp. N11]MBX0355280.1 preprotein translocase [Bacillus toyonensis]MDF9447826.1 preprotein translocase [Bacillus toyonensis]
MANSEMILRLLTDLKIEQQALREQLEKMQTALTILEEKPNTPEEKSTIIEEKSAVTKQRAYSGRPTSFRDWRASTQKNS